MAGTVKCQALSEIGLSAPLIARFAYAWQNAGHSTSSSVGRPISCSS